MRLFELFEADEPKRKGDKFVDPSVVMYHDDSNDQSQQAHWDAHRETGFYGKQGSGSVFLARDTGRLLLAHRSKDVEQPHTWGNWGGAVDEGYSTEQNARKEIEQECGYIGPYDLIPLLLFQKNSFRYQNYLAVIPHEFTPALNWESQGYRWCEFGKWPSPLHFGLVSLFNDPKSVEIIRAEIEKSRA